MRPLLAAGAWLQGSQLSVQALTRLCSVYVFLLASWADTDRLPAVALQGALLAIPYTLLEALVGRPLSAGLVPSDWHAESWAGRVAAATLAPVALVGYLCATVALPDRGAVDRLLLLAPVLLQLPLEAFFWVTAGTRSPRRANLVPQLTAVGTLLGGAVFVVLDLRIDLVAVPAQLAVLAWVLLRRPVAGPMAVRPGLRRGLRVGSVYCLAAGVDLSYTVTLPSVAGAVAGPAGVVVLRAMDLVFGPFHVALSASVREDVVAGRRGRRWTGSRMLTVAALVVVSAALLASGPLRALVAPDLATVGIGALAMYCGYKALLAATSWLSTRHMIWAAPRRYLVSALGSRVIAFAGLTVSALRGVGVTGLIGQLLVAEALVACWFLVRMRRRAAPDTGASTARGSNRVPTAEGAGP